MNASRRNLLISSVAAASALAVSRATFADTLEVGDPDQIVQTFRRKSDAETTLPRYAGGGVCDSCSFLKGNASDAFATCPMFARASRWQQRNWCSAYSKNA
jgi:high potential iron-sulfur protein